MGITRGLGTKTDARRSLFLILVRIDHWISSGHQHASVGIQCHQTGLHVNLQENSSPVRSTGWLFAFAGLNGAIKREPAGFAVYTENNRGHAIVARGRYLSDWYVATYEQEWVALLSFSASALKCAARDKWIGWDFRCQYGRLKLIANNSRFLILPDWHRPNLGTKVLALCQRRIGVDWLAHFKQPLLLLETFVDTARYRGTVYRAGNWTCVGQTQGHRRIREGYSEHDGTPKLVFVRALRHDSQLQLSRPLIQEHYRQESPKIMISIEHLSALPHYFKDIPDTRRSQGRRHPQHVVLALAAGATLCGMEGYKAIGGWVKDLGAKARERFGCRIDKHVGPVFMIEREVFHKKRPKNHVRIGGWRHQSAS